jgi:hypothetical protein
LLFLVFFFSFLCSLLFLFNPKMPNPQTDTQTNTQADQAGQDNQPLSINAVKDLIDKQVKAQVEAQTQSLKDELTQQKTETEKLKGELAYEKQGNVKLTEALTMQAEQVQVLATRASCISKLPDVGQDEAAQDAKHRVVQLMDYSVSLYAEVKSLPPDTLPPTCTILGKAEDMHHLVQVMGAGLEIFAHVPKKQGPYAYGQYCRKAGKKVQLQDYVKKGKRGYDEMDPKIAEPIIKEAKERQDKWEKRQKPGSDNKQGGGYYNRNRNQQGNRQDNYQRSSSYGNQQGQWGDRQQGNNNGRR